MRRLFVLLVAASLGLPAAGMAQKSIREFTHDMNAQLSISRQSMATTQRN